MKRLIFGFILAAVLTAGCSSTQTRREAYVRANPLMPETKAAQILRGEVWRGMTKEDVLAAWGDPTYFIPGYSDATVSLETWIYCYHLVFGTGYYRLDFRDGILEKMVREYY